MGFWIIMIGILAASSLVITKVPALKDYVARLSMYQGWIAIVSAVFGLIVMLPKSISWMTTSGLFKDGLVLLVGAVLNVAIGLLLGVATARPFIKNEQAVAKLDLAVSKLAPYQTTLGIAAIVTGIVSFFV